MGAIYSLQLHCLPEVYNVNALASTSSIHVPPMGAFFYDPQDECRTFCSSGSNNFKYTGTRRIRTDTPGGSTTYTLECRCYDQPTTPDDYAAASSGQNCADVDYHFALTSTTFDNINCFTRPAPADLKDWTTTLSVDQCFAQCRYDTTANVVPDPLTDNFLCKCTDTRPLPPFTAGSEEACTTRCDGLVSASIPMDDGTGRVQCYCQSPPAPSDGLDIVDCDASSLYVYQHPEPEVRPVPSGLPEKRAQLRDRLARRRREKVHAFCPEGLVACSVDSRDSEGYECIDPLTELESCGGCVNGVFRGRTSPDQSPSARNGSGPGVDCTKLDGIPLGGVTCQLGHCAAMACEEGYSLVDSACARL